MSEYTIRATITVTGGEADRAKIQAGLDAGLRELPGVASRYGFTITDAHAEIDDASA